MYGLFKNTYDYYEWHDLVCVSGDESKLVDKCEGKEHPLLTGEEQDLACNAERVHYVIEKIEIIHPITPPKGERMPMTEAHFNKVITMRDELIFEQKDEISKLKTKVNKLQQKLTKNLNDIT